MDIENLLRLLKERDAQFVIIGATAFPVHGYARATIDIDLFIKNTTENAAKIHAALQDFGYDISDLSLDDIVSKKVLIRQYLAETDLHPFVAGVHFDEVWRNKIEDQLGDTTVYFASLHDLIRMKKAAGRPKDIDDLRALEKIEEKRRREHKPLDENNV